MPRQHTEFQQPEFLTRLTSNAVAGLKSSGLKQRRWPKLQGNQYHGFSSKWRETDQQHCGNQSHGNEFHIHVPLPVSCPCYRDIQVYL
jgi:hypothetical protein